MTRRPLLVATLACAAACAGGSATTGGGAIPAPTPSTPPAPASPAALQLAPGTTRYLVRQDVHIQQDYAGLPPSIDLRYGLYLTATIAGPVDTSGYLASFSVDSVTVDSGSQLPPQINLAAAKGFRVTGRLSPTGEFKNPLPSDSATATSLGNLLPRFRSFFPRLPAGGVRPGDSWTDSASATDGAGGATITTHSVNRRAATTWEDHAGARALRLEVSASFSFSGTGEQSGAPFTIDGSGTGTGLQFLTGDGRYLGGESRDSTALTIDLPAQGISIPRRQLARTTITVLPK